MATYNTTPSLIIFIIFCALLTERTNYLQLHAVYSNWSQFENTCMFLHKKEEAFSVLDLVSML